MQSKYKKSRFHVINDPIHGTMEFTTSEKKVIKPIIDSVAFQRLRHIKQLGMTDLVFPGAVHTRFNHCLGACFLAKRMSEKINLKDKEKELILISALIHDIGHGPFSHAFEKLLSDKNGKKLVDHEDWTPFFIEKLKKEKRLNLNKDQQNRILASIKHDNLKNFKQAAADIVSSQLDCDRLDYLLRDSHFCGVSYGEYDISWLLPCLTTVQESKKSPRLGVTRKGIGTIEQLLIARRLMHQNVYYNGKIKIAEHLLIEFLRLLMNDIRKLPIKVKPIISENLFNFLKEADSLIRKSEKLSDGLLKKEIQKFKKRAFPFYQVLADQDIWITIREVYLRKNIFSNDTREVAKRLFERKLPKVYYIEKSFIEGVGFMVSDFQKKEKIRNWKMGVLELPVKSYKADESPILVLQDNGTSRTLTSSSNLISSVSDISEKTCFLYIDDCVNAKTLINDLIKKHYLILDK